jgi:hypothetical protein
MTGASGSVMEGVAGMGVDGGARVVGGEEKEEVLDGNDGAVGGAGSGVVAVLLAGGEVARWLGEPTQSAGGPWASTGVPGRPGRRRQGGGQREGRPAATGGTMKKKRDRIVFLLKHERVQAAGTQAVGEKNFVFGRNTLQIVIFFTS